MASASRAPLLSRALQAGAASRSVLTLLRPLSAATNLLSAGAGARVRYFATQPATSSLPDSYPNWNNRPPKKTTLIDGCDFEHWLVVMQPPPGDASNPDITRDEIIDSYIKTLAQVVGSEEEARQKIYSVSTRHYFAFGAIVSEELSYKLKELPKVRWVLPDSYLDVKNKDYGGEPFINGEAVPYDPKYHEQWVRNKRRACCKESNSDDGNDSNDRSGLDDQGDGSNSDNGSDLDDQGDGSDSGDQGDGSDSGDQGDGSNSNDESDSDDQGDGSDLDNRSEAKEATHTTKVKEVTWTTEETQTTHKTKAKDATRTTRTTKAKEVTRLTRTIEATRTTEVTRMTKATEVTRTTEAKEATQTIRTIETTRTTKVKEATRTT